MNFMKCPDCGADYLFEISEVDEYFISADGMNLICSTDLQKQGGRSESGIRCGCRDKSYQWRFDNTGRLILTPADEQPMQTSPMKKSLFDSTQNIGLLKCPDCGNALIYKHIRIRVYRIVEDESRQPDCERDAYLIKEGLWSSCGVREKIRCNICGFVPQWQRSSENRIILIK